MEAVLAICTILGTIIAVYQYRQSKAEPKELKETLLAQYNTSRHLITTLISDLKDYAQSHNAGEEIFGQGVTFKGYIAYLEDMYNKELSDKLYEDIKTMKLSKSNIQAMQSGLEKQISSFNQSQAYFDTNFRYK